MEKEYYFNCDEETNAYCQLDFKHDKKTLKAYEAFDKDSWRKVLLCQDHFENHKKYHWKDIKIMNLSPISISDGYHCEKCNDYCQFAQSNQDNGTFICYSCRK